MAHSEALAPTMDPRYALTDPADQSITFMRDIMHFPNPVSPLFESLHPLGFSPGMVTAAKELAVPIADVQYRYRNHYQYEIFVPVVPASEDEAHAIGERAEASLKAELPRMRQRWDNEHLPRLQVLLARLAEIRTLDADAPLDPALVDELVDIYRELWTIHFRIAIPMLTGMQVFDEFVSDVAGPEVDCHALLTGIHTASVSSGIAITDLAASARAAGLSSVVLETPANQLASRLSDNAEGRAWLSEVDAYLNEYGLCQDMFEFALPTWLEDPTPLFRAIQGYLATGGDNRAAHERKVRQTEEATNAIRQRLSTYPEPVRGQFEALLTFARDANFLQEEHNFYIDQKGISSVRLAFLAIGRQLAAAGMLAQPDDIFMLHVDEIRGLLAGETVDAKAIAAARRASLAAARNETPPRFIGKPPTAPPMDNPTLRGLVRFFGGPPPASTDPNVVPGTAGSRGELTAPAFVARSLEEAGGVPSGHVLVTITTSPSWTPLFGIAGALVTETGGPLSHCAVVAREYGIPAVVGAAGATQRLKTGQTIRVDGTSGEVTILS